MAASSPFSTRQPAEARRIVRSALEGAPPEVRHIAELLTSELVNNAIVHGSGDPTLVLQVGEVVVRVEVRDADPTTNLTPLSPEPTSVGGRGLAIVDALALRWGVSPRPDGKAVWFELNTQGEAETGRRGTEP